MSQRSLTWLFMKISSLSFLKDTSVIGMHHESSLFALNYENEFLSPDSLNQSQNGYVNFVPRTLA